VAKEGFFLLFQQGGPSVVKATSMEAVALMGLVDPMLAAKMLVDAANATATSVVVMMRFIMGPIWGLVCNAL